MKWSSQTKITAVGKDQEDFIRHPPLVTPKLLPLKCIFFPFRFQDYEIEVIWKCMLGNECK